jgi:hypothetical protein
MLFLDYCSPRFWHKGCFRKKQLAQKKGGPSYAELGSHIPRRCVDCRSARV